MATTRSLDAQAATEAVDALDGDLTMRIASHRSTAIRGSDTIVEISERKVAPLAMQDQRRGEPGVEAPGTVRL